MPTVVKKLTKNLTFWVLIAGVLGYFSALLFGDPEWTVDTSPPAFYEFILLLKTVFLALLKMLVAPIIFFSLIGGLLNIGDASRLKNLGIDLGTTGIVTVFFMAMVSSIGAPGMPSGSMAGMQMVLLGAGIPLEAIGILLVVERPLDTIRTAVNVEGDLIGALVTQRFFSKTAA